MDEKIPAMNNSAANSFTDADFEPYIKKTDPSDVKLLALAHEAFLRHEYKVAVDQYHIILEKYPDDTLIVFCYTAAVLGLYEKDDPKRGFTSALAKLDVILGRSPETFFLDKEIKILAKKLCYYLLDELLTLPQLKSKERYSKKQAMLKQEILDYDGVFTSPIHVRAIIFAQYCVATCFYRDKNFSAFNKWLQPIIKKYKGASLLLCIDALKTKDPNILQNVIRELHDSAMSNKDLCCFSALHLARYYNKNSEDAKAEFYLKRVVKFVSPAVWYEMSYRLTKKSTQITDKEEAIKILIEADEWRIKAADKGFHLAEYYCGKKLFESDIVISIRYLRSAAYGGIVNAQYRLALIYLLAQSSLQELRQLQLNSSDGFLPKVVDLKFQLELKRYNTSAVKKITIQLLIKLISSYPDNSFRGDALRLMLFAQSKFVQTLPAAPVVLVVEQKASPCSTAVILNVTQPAEVEMKMNANTMVEDCYRRGIEALKSDVEQARVYFIKGYTSCSNKKTRAKFYYQLYLITANEMTASLYLRLAAAQNYEPAVELRKMILSSP